MIFCGGFRGVQRDQAKAILSKQAVKIATKAEQHERLIFKVISRLWLCLISLLLSFFARLMFTNLGAPVFPFFIGI